MVSLKGSSDFVVRDVTDINHPFTVSSLGNQVDYATQFVNAAELSAVIDGTGLVRTPLSGSPKTVVAACGTRLFAWSPDGTIAAYIAGSQSPAMEALHVVSGGQDNIVNTIPNPIQGGFGCESRLSCAGWAFRVLYSPNGAYVATVQFPGTGLHVWTAGGKLLMSATTSAATMPAWSGDTLYWSDSNGVETWHHGSQSLLLPGVGWIGPHASAAGGLIVYESRDAGTFTPRVHVLDTATGKTREIGQSRSYPAFLTARYIWYAGERPCAASEPCTDPMTLTGVTYIYDLQTGTEAQSIITRVYDVWPHPA